ncbi:3-isopropylmalate dehydrogenase [Chitinophagaceae bacterium LB-8]|uniref:3-isopropylmalate dehydrogenase n=1 Tax=Paraflavisolibacter caeni TaxID=2982496 RepID=A0A9X3BIW8_9BACT|nr:3-isopropylmalate dehydrogenase [Paraflavisolibacter caeni]MCU7550553.1 3-isopropylmalate dehydrogenase [Paraflavisolibacter caeni]
MVKNIAVILGDGIGPEVTQQAIRVLNAIAEQFRHQFNYTYCLMGAGAIEKTGNPLPSETLEICKKSDAILFGAIGHPRFDNDPTADVRPEQGLLKLRQELQLFANIRPVSTDPALFHLSPLKSKYLEDVDFVVYRELTGGIYFGEKKINETYTEASDLCIYTRSEIERIAHLAFQSAKQRKKKLTLIDKANVLATSRLWRKVVKDLSHQYKDVKVEYLYADNAAVQIIINPKQFDVILTENLLGDFISDVAATIGGSIGLLPSASVGVSTSLFEPIHGSYPQAAGKDIANPIGSILSAAMMLEYFQLTEEASLIRSGVAWALGNGFVTKDIDPVNYYFTSTIGELISDFVQNKITTDVNRNNIELRKSTII